MNSMTQRLSAYALVTLTFLCWGLVSLGQDKVTVHGVIRSDDGSVLPFATVSVVGTQQAITTDSLGKYSLTVATGATLQFSFVGHESQTRKVTGAATINISLTADQAAGLDNVVVVGYGKQKAPTVTGAVGTVSGEDLVQTPVSSVTSMLVGRSSGISSVQASGEPGRNAATIRIRGVATLNGQDPLIVIDGVQQPAEQPYVVLNSMDANEIESISILKDASATAVYGIRGANGVIVVTTKRGKSTRPQFSFTANQGYTHATSVLQTLNSYQFAQLRNEAVYNAQASGNNTLDNLLFTDDDLWKFQHNRDYTPAEVAAMTNLTADQQQALLNSPALYYTSHNYYEELFSGTGKQQQYNLNVSGGTNKVKYFTSLGAFYQNGILTNTSYGGANTNPSYTRYNFRSNFDIDVVKNFRLSVNLAGQSGIAKGPGANYSTTDLGDRYQNIIQSILESSPFVGPGIVDGHLVTSFVGNPGDATNPLGAQGGTGLTPLTSVLSSGTRSDYVTTLTTNVILRHTMDYITPGLESHVSVAYDDSYTKGYARVNSVPEYSAMRDPSDPAKILFLGGQINPTDVSDNVGNSSWRKVYLEAGINYNRSFGPHSVTGLILGNAQRYTANGMSYNTPSGLMGLVGRATYNFKEKYLAEFNLGINGTENFAPGKRFGYFPAISAGWIVSKESFFPKNKWVTWVKLRGSYGQVGNDQMGSRRYLYLPNSWSYSGWGYYFGNSNGSSSNPYYSGATETALGNPDVTWERAKKTNIALDLKFFNDRLFLNSTYFHETRDDILVTLQTIPSTYGVSSSNVPPANVGQVTNQGYEFEAGWDDQVGDVRYFAKANFSYARNKIVYQAEPAYEYEWMNTTGYSIGQYKGLLADGFYNTTDELNNRPYNSYSAGLARLGDIKFKDVNGDGLIDTKDNVPIGYSNLPRIAYNLSLGFSYKGFDINALFIGTAQGSFRQDGYILSSPFAKNVGEVMQYMFDGRWTADRYAKGEAIYYPAITLGTGGQDNTTFSDFWLKSNSFQRLKNLEIGYTFQHWDFMKNTGIKGIRLYVNGNNLITWGSNLIDGIDPELADSGKSYMGYLFPVTRTYNVGANIQF